MTTELATAEGVLELHPRGYGFLRSPQRSYTAGNADIYVPGPLIQRLGLRETQSAEHHRQEIVERVQRGEDH